ncbi:translation elongation factor-like protein [candidate division TA06 bacterium DG_24]|jgi:translation elongation factor EF-1alpha|uniref:Translation elongation factor-like protein n=3 Tax=Bacteria division TA06 TaxID=1156500 RepID=A0A0S8JMV8_UNCT6|nr:MAG: translation elongation factor-like protein [candidate division TA06 bacterium DG_24]KPK68609.1 MAG: translation elongation factor-like protein [candidate division TA06 bacterium SM23_40]KPL10848.1 MAG: translation elongation factor-like protein [candidate division TA06 bacterium SM1_40]
MEELEIGKVEDYFAKIGVAGIQLTGEIAVGDTIHIKGHTTDLTEMVMSIQIEHESVERAGSGDLIGIKVSDRCRQGDHVYKVIE